MVAEFFSSGMVLKLGFDVGAVVGLAGHDWQGFGVVAFQAKAASWLERTPRDGTSGRKCAHLVGAVLRLEAGAKFQYFAYTVLAKPPRTMREKPQTTHLMYSP